MPIAEAAPAEDIAPALASVSIRRNSAPLSSASLIFTEGVKTNTNAAPNTHGLAHQTSWRVRLRRI
ncbi:MAG: hypothetical protein Q8O90_03925, partial [Elusimicrobiota bacterium]|nr:hypothetical protein [Elusimicrobiota bacterium]